MHIIVNSRFVATPIPAGALFRGQKTTPKACSLLDLRHAATSSSSFLPKMPPSDICFFLTPPFRSRRQRNRFSLFSHFSSVCRAHRVQPQSGASPLRVAFFPALFHCTGGTRRANTNNPDNAQGIFFFLRKKRRGSVPPPQRTAQQISLAMRPPFFFEIDAGERVSWWWWRHTEQPFLTTGRSHERAQSHEFRMRARTRATTHWSAISIVGFIRGDALGRGDGMDSGRDTTLWSMRLCPCAVWILL